MWGSSPATPTRTTPRTTGTQWPILSTFWWLSTKEKSEATLLEWYYSGLHIARLGPSASDILTEIFYICSEVFWRGESLPRGFVFLFIWFITELDQPRVEGRRSMPHQLLGGDQDLSRLLQIIYSTLYSTVLYCIDSINFNWQWNLQVVPTHHNYAWPLVSWDVLCLNSSEALKLLD